ncbi:MAG0490 family ComEA-like DNA-binding protein [Mycoplasma nasistruthionis]|uniref:Uncharacterized protein n=1 Tax=Mycoplasma nasistruthionis TaxID=353852 RepID=A0A4Y6I5C5_9MOLU|nr:hypothetical protein [Mycoplasma nasistruthionis]QDF64815.1 hypothetical protein FIV53_00600 [Mycoplasma nasistruthionis]
MTKKILLATICLLICIGATIGIERLINTKVVTSKQKQFKTYSYKVTGAVFDDSKVTVVNPLSYRQLFFLVGVSPYSDLSDFDLDELAPVNQEIYVPVSDYKFSWEDFKSEQDFRNVGISYKDSNILFKYKSQGHEITSWKQLNYLRGVSTKSKLALKNLLRLI